MSAFDLAGDHDSASLIDNARANPLDLSQSAGFFSGMATGAATGVGRLLADTQRTTGLALGAVAGSFDMLTGDALKAQDKVFEHIVTPADKLSRHLAPKPEEIGMAGQLLHGLVKIGGEAVAFGAPGVLVNETVGGTLDALDKGVDLQTAGKVGGVQGAAMTAGVIAPMTLGASGLGMNVLYGAGINLAQGIFQRGATSEIYANAGRPDLAAQFKALDGEAMVVDAILGAAFAGGGRYLQLRGEKAKSDAVAEYKAKISEMLRPEHIDAALTKNEQLKMERSGMGLPADLASRDAHVTNLAGAIDDLIEGRPVTVRQPDLTMIPDEAAAKVQADVAEVLRAEVEPKVGAGDTALPPDVERAALKKASDVQNEKDAFDIAEEIRSLEEGGGVDLSKLSENPKFWDEENEQWTPEGQAAADSATRAQAIDNVGLLDITELSDLNLAHHKAQYAAMLEILDGLRIPYADTSSAQSKYIEVGGYKLRFADHANQVRDSAVRGSLPVLNVAPGESTFADALRVVMESTPTANKPELSQGLPRDGMQERAVRADKSGSPEPAQSDGAVGGEAKTTATLSDVQALRPDAVIPLDDADATTTVAEAQGIITDLETAAREQETGLRAAVACFLRAA